MEEKVLKQFKTTCPFPLLVYKTHVKYNEVRKASGIAYILLNLIQKEGKSREKISDVLLKIGIPQDLHYIFGQEMANLLSTDIIESNVKPTHFINLKYFRQITLSDVALTAKGKKMFQEGAIPTGAEKVKVKDIYYSPVTRKFDVESKTSYMSLASTFLGVDFMDRVKLDISGMEDYINANGSKIGIKAEERIVSFEYEEPQKLHVRKEDGMTIIIRPSGVEFKFDTSDENVFFHQYFDSKLMTRGLLVKNKYKFVNSKKEALDIPTVNLKELLNISNIYIPDDAQKQASRPCKFFFNRNRLGVKGFDSAIQLTEDDANVILNILDKNAEFALLDKETLKYYNALNVAMPCEKFGDVFEIQLLVEQGASDEVLKKILEKLYSIYFEKGYSTENGRAMLFIIDTLNQPVLFEEYSINKLDKCNAIDEKIDLLLKLNTSFKANKDWKVLFNNLGKKLLISSAEEIKLDNMIYKNTILTPLKNELGMSGNDYIEFFSKAVINEDRDLVCQALETAGFETSQILGVVNVVEDYMNKILNDENISADTNISHNFKIISVNLWNLNDMLGIVDYSNCTLKDDYNIDDFFKAYETLSKAVKGIDKYSRFASEQFNKLKKYLAIYEPIHEFLSIERDSSSHPDKISKKYINDNLTKGRFKNAICDLLVKLQYDLRKILEAGDLTDAHELINMAEKAELIDATKRSSLHTMRKARNGFQHPEREQIQYTKNDIEEWRDIVFEIGGNK